MQDIFYFFKKGGLDSMVSSQFAPKGLLLIHPKQCQAYCKRGRKNCRVVLFSCFAFTALLNQSSFNLITTKQSTTYIQQKVQLLYGKNQILDRGECLFSSSVQIDCLCSKREPFSAVGERAYLEVHRHETQFSFSSL